MPEFNLKKIGLSLVFLSAFLLAVSVPTSIALDNTALAIGGLGILLLLLSKDFSNFPDHKPLLFIIVPDILTMISQWSFAFFRMSSINQHLLSYFIPYKAFKEKEKIVNTVLILLGIASILLFFSLLFQALTWQNIKHINFHHLVVHHTIIRANGFLGNPLTTASVVTLLLFLFFGLFLRKRKLFYFAVSIAMFLSIILEQSRSSWLGFIIASVFLGFFLIKKSKIFAVVSVLLVVIFVAIIFSTPNLKSRFMSSFNPNANWSNKDRIILWHDYIKTFKEYSLKQKLFGAGKETRKLIWRNFKASFREVTGKTESYRILKAHFHGGASHNIYLRYLDETGIIGLLGFILFWIYFFWINFKAFNQSGELLFVSFIAGYIAFLVIGIFENNFVDATVKVALMFTLSVNLYFIDSLHARTSTTHTNH